MGLVGSSAMETGAAMRIPWPRDTLERILLVGGILVVLAFAAIMVGMVGMAIETTSQSRELRKLSPAEQAVERHVMPDGTVCYQPRSGWSRPVSCVRPP
jgi:hypothetical protein